ncbi:helix-turn-helix transcriptional regulator [Pelosinus propionicus]|uniref:DNA-binding transcriptional regulator, XRE-family HTH domain n=1 Tax=Pelosinus propionicus DSM 13327 TaxID=1123291 RepID=A0A1I4NG81_9FIRM|nr:helix-turn-helix transcriptional regulator [Pelosinus propionicus]SFM14317.1 DNA-binding transcriptional regulator, XRE-family HTH domain [Pelosinus propionicus DSM 13327]
MSLSIKKARLMKDLKQDDLAKTLGIHVQTYRKIEQNPELATIAQAKKISKIVDIPYDEIFFSRDST